MSLTSTTGQRMLARLPGFYETSRVMQEILQAQGAELDDMWAGISEVLAQFFTQAATWGIDLWEEELGLTPDQAQTAAERRSRVLGRLRGYGTLTIKLLKQVAEAYDNGRVDVIPDPPASVMVVRFVDTTGVPPNVEDLKAELRKLMPADWDIQYEYNYTLVYELATLTVAQVAAYTVEQALTIL